VKGLNGMSDSYQRPDVQAVAELERLAALVVDEAGLWRRRCLRAEQELQELRARGGVLADTELHRSRDRVAELEQENAELRQRIVQAKERVTALGARLAFLEQGSEVA
jgi:predicted nuclease with TOPRIM domain